VIHGLVIFALLLVTCARQRPAQAVGGCLVTATLFAAELPSANWAGWVVGVTVIAVIGRLVSTRQALVQAETAGYRVPDLPESARVELLAIGETVRSALTETRALLLVLRQTDQPVPAAPQPGLDQTGALVEAAQRAGVRLEAQIDGLPNHSGGTGQRRPACSGGTGLVAVNPVPGGLRLLVANAAVCCRTVSADRRAGTIDRSG